VALSFGDLTQAEPPDDGALAQELKRAVKAGRLTTEEAVAKRAAFKKSTAVKGQENDGPKSVTKAVYFEIQVAVKAGKLPPKEAAVKLAALKTNRW
jgi:hypothetical protein